MDWSKLKFWERKEDPVLSPQGPSSQEEQRLISYALKPVMLKKLKWVVVENTGRVGIITAIDAGSMVNVDLVQDDGTTYASLRTQAGNVRIAQLKEIPLCRRPANPAYAATLGYF